MLHRRGERALGIVPEHLARVIAVPSDFAALHQLAPIEPEKLHRRFAAGNAAGQRLVQQQRHSGVEHRLLVDIDAVHHVMVPLDDRQPVARIEAVDEVDRGFRFLLRDVIEVAGEDDEVGGELVGFLGDALDHAGSKKAADVQVGDVRDRDAVEVRREGRDRDRSALHAKFPEPADCAGAHGDRHQGWNGDGAGEQRFAPAEASRSLIVGGCGYISWRACLPPSISRRCRFQESRSGAAEGARDTPPRAA